MGVGDGEGGTSVRKSQPRRVVMAGQALKESAVFAEGPSAQDGVRKKKQNDPIPTITTYDGTMQRGPGV